MTCTAFGQAADACGSAPTVGEGTHAYDLNGSTNDFAGTCGLTGTAQDVWYRYVAGACGTATIETCGQTTGDSVLSALDECGGTVLACVDDSCGLQTRMSFEVVAGEDYYIRIADFNGGTHAGNIAISIAGVFPPNDECGGAIAIGLGATAYNTGCATTSGAAGPCGGLGSDLWFSYTSACEGTLTATTCSANRSYDTVLAAYDGCGGNLRQCNDDGPPSCTNPGVPFSGSTVSFGVAAGSTTFFRVGGFQGARGSSELTLSFSGGPANNECANAIAIGEGVTPYSTVCATTDGPAGCSALNDIWYLYTATNSCSTTVTTCSANRNYDTLIGVYEGSCGGALLGCNDDGPPSCRNAGVPFSGSTVTFNAVAGGQYLIRVGGFAGGTGSSDLTITQGPTNDNCANAIAVGLGTIPYNTGCATTDGPAACGGLGNDIWYSYAAPNAARLTVSTCSPNRTYDTVLAVYDGPCTGAEVGCNDDGPPSCGNPGVPFSGSTVVFAPVGGNQYLIRVGGFVGARGSSELTISRACFGGCVADFDDGSNTNSPDGGVTIEDLLYYLAIFGDGVLCADIDDGSGTGTQDGGVTIDDLLYFIARFNQGC